MKKKHRHQPIATKDNVLRAGHERIILRSIEPIARLVRAAGLSAANLGELYEIAAVRLESETKRKNGNSVSISEIAATTGIPRNKISRILNIAPDLDDIPKTKSRQPANRILQAWKEKTQFRDKNGEPANLKLYSKGVSFDLLVRENGAGVPTRAALDALVNADAVEIKSGNLISVKTKTLCRIATEVRVLELFVERLWSVMDGLVKGAMTPTEGRFLSGEYRIPMQASTRREIQNDLLGSGFRLMFPKKTISASESRIDESPGAEKTERESVLTFFCQERSRDKSRVDTAIQKRSNFKRKM